MLDLKDVTPEILEVFHEAIEGKMNGLCSQGAFRVVPRRTLPPKPKILAFHFVLCVKDIGNKTERQKARLVALDHLDILKDYMLTDSLTLMRYAMRLLLFLASARGLKLYSRDMRQAYLQADSDLQMDIFLLSPKGFSKIAEDEIL